MGNKFKRKYEELTIMLKLAHPGLKVIYTRDDLDYGMQIYVKGRGDGPSLIVENHFVWWKPITMLINMIIGKGPARSFRLEFVRCIKNQGVQELVLSLLNEHSARKVNNLNDVVMDFTCDHYAYVHVTHGELKKLLVNLVGLLDRELA